MQLLFSGKTCPNSIQHAHQNNKPIFTCGSHHASCVCWVYDETQMVYGSYGTRHCASFENDHRPKGQASFRVLPQSINT